LRRVGCDSIVDAKRDFNGSGQKFGLDHRAMSTGFSIICLPQGGGIVFANQLAVTVFNHSEENLARIEALGRHEWRAVWRLAVIT
jgi:hypothetical protein